MRIEFELTKIDLYEFYKFHYWYSPDKKYFRIKTRLLSGFILLVLPFLCYILIGNTFTDKVLLNLSILSLWLFLLGFYFAKSRILSYSEKVIDNILKEGKNANLLGKMTFEFSNGIIECRTENSESKINYKTIEKVMQDDNYFFIYLNMISAHVIPKKALQSDQEKTQFNEIIKNLA